MKKQLHNIFKMMKLFKKTIFSIFGAALLATGFVACSSDDNSTTESTLTAETTNSTMSVKSITNKIPVEERENIYNYFIEYYKITDELEILLVEENLNLDNEFVNKLEKIEHKSNLISLLADYNFSKPEIYINKFEKINLLHTNLKEKNPEFFKLNDSIKENIFFEIMEVSFNDYYRPITISRTCKEQYDIDVSRAKRNFAICGTGAVVAAGFTGGIGGLITGSICMATYYYALDDSLVDYNDCIK